MQPSRGRAAQAALQQQTMPSDFGAQGLDLLYEDVMGKVDDDQLDNLMHDDFMARLVLESTKLSHRRAKNFKTYESLHRLIFYSLLVQGILGVSVAFWKTILQPDKLFKVWAALKNVDMILMLDSSRHNGETAKEQHKAVTKFTEHLWNKTEEIKQAARNEVQIAHEETKMHNANILYRLFAPKESYNVAQVEGGDLWVATGLYNGRSIPVHDFTKNQSKHKERVFNISNDSYTATGEWYSAISQCEQFAENKQHGKSGMRFCLIIGDSDSQCQKQEHEPEVDEFCIMFPDACPDVYDQGSLLEEPDDLQNCSGKSRSLKGRFNISLIFILLAKGKEAAQRMLKLNGFREFITNITECEFKETEVYIFEGENGSAGKWVEKVYQPIDCARFVLAYDYDDMYEKAKAIADLLVQEPASGSQTNPNKDHRYLCFLLLPANLLIFLAWSKIVSWSSQTYTAWQRQRSEKKSMIKVTKTVVEKEKRASIVHRVDQLKAGLSEIELQSLASARPCVRFGLPVHLRCRLGGGYLRRNDRGTASIKDDIADGLGACSLLDSSADWFFEPVGATSSGAAAGTVRAGQQVRIRNGQGEYLYATERSRKGGGNTAFKHEDCGTDVVWEMDTFEPKEGDPCCRLGDVVCIRSLCKEGYLRVDKEGKCDTHGKRSQPEVQFVIDCGGPAISSGDVVRLRAAAGRRLLLAPPTGDLTCLELDEGGDPQDRRDALWASFLISKVGYDAPGSFGGANGRSSPSSSTGVREAGRKSRGCPLVQGDVVTLKGLNQKSVAFDDASRRCHAGNATGENVALKEALEGYVCCPGDASRRGSAEGGGATQWIVERTGMGLLARSSDATLRVGMEICLKPYSEADDPVASSTYLRLQNNGTLTADGSPASPSIRFVVELSNLFAREPLVDFAPSGDSELSLAPLWNKEDCKKYRALLAAWTRDEDLVRFQGKVVVASPGLVFAVYTGPRAKAESWIGVVQDTDDIFKAAVKAKQQGAAALIVLCSQALSLEKAVHPSCSTGGCGLLGVPEYPTLPAVFVDKASGEALNGSGLFLNSVEIVHRNFTEAIRAVTSPSAIPAHAHTRYGWFLLGRLLESLSDANGGMEAAKRLWSGRRASEIPCDSDRGPSVNTGAGRRVDGGAPRSAAHGAPRAGAHSSAHRPRRKSVVLDKAKGLWQKTKGLAKRAAPKHRPGNGTILKETTIVDSKELQAKFGSRTITLQKTMAEWQRHDQMQFERLEQLSEESDFVIKFSYEEIEVGKHESPQDLQEDEELKDSEGIARAIGVPQRNCYLLALGLVLSTTLVVSLLVMILMEPVDADDSKWTEAAAASQPASFLAGMKFGFNRANTAPE